MKIETDIAQENVQKIFDNINIIEGKLKALQTGFLKNVRDADEVKSEAKTLAQEIDETDKKALKLVAAYNNANDTLKNRVKNSQATHTSSQQLLERASQLSANTTLKLKELGGIVKKLMLKMKANYMLVLF